MPRSLRSHCMTPALAAFCVASLISLERGVATAQVKPPPLELIVSAKPDSVAPGDSLVIELRVYNAGRIPVRVVAPLEWPSPALFVSMRGPGGLSIEAHNYDYTDRPVQAMGDRWETRIPPGSFIGRKFTLARTAPGEGPHFRLDRPGAYLFSVRLQLYLPDANEVISLEGKVRSVQVR